MKDVKQQRSFSENTLIFTKAIFKILAKGGTLSVRLWKNYEEKKYFQDIGPQLKKRYEELETSYLEIKNRNESLVALSVNLSKYLSPQVYRSIFSGEKSVKVESSRKILTVFLTQKFDSTQYVNKIGGKIPILVAHSPKDEVISYFHKDTLIRENGSDKIKFCKLNGDHNNIDYNEKYLKMIKDYL